MARKNSDGKYILSAGEIGTFAVCPESWRLRVIDGVKVSKSDRSLLGEELHLEWAVQNEEALYFAKGVRLIVILTAFAIVVSICLALAS